MTEYLPLSPHGNAAPHEPTSGADDYDRNAAATIVAALAYPDLFPTPSLTFTPRRFDYTSTEIRPEPGGQLTLSQRLYLERFMRPCTPEQVTTASHRLTWNDSAGVPNTGHYRVGGLGPAVPIVAREAARVLWATIDTDPGFAHRVSALPAADRRILDATTTDGEPVDIFRVGIEATARTLVQHALLADRTPYRTATEFAHGLRDSGIFTAAATRWYWELQASTYRRGMIPVDLVARPDGTVAYSQDTLTTLRAMKDATIADAHAVMHRATTEEGLDVDAAIAKYHDDLDLISRQYALLPTGAQPACLAAQAHRRGGQHHNLLSLVVDRFVAVFAELAPRCAIVEVRADHDAHAERPATAQDQIFAVPDMNCRHCVRTIGGVLESMGIEVLEIDLLSKRVVAEFRSPRNRARAFEALRDSGYNPSDAPVDPQDTSPPNAGVPADTAARSSGASANNSASPNNPASSINPAP
ncbi:heavy-metal-associated domain-containing protein [Nocardia callitridis]|uniref:Copper chaperone CopZ n=1 Tax=Nocardia callitridis TaxID=648753 RepID=A0ABP9K202_9NOCA